MIAILCGIIVGVEREKKEKAAGLRTLTLVTVGAAVFTMISLSVGESQGDPGRIAAQVVSGVGFLGAGAILRGERGVQGLTTAATIWAMAAIGMTVGLGLSGRGHRTEHGHCDGSSGGGLRGNALHRALHHVAGRGRLRRR